MIVRKKFIAASTVFCVLCSFTGCAKDFGDDLVNADVIEITRQDLRDDINIVGYICGNEISIDNNQTTACVEVKVKEGDNVKEGDVLFVFDKTDLQNQYDDLLMKYNAERDKSNHQHEVNEKMLQSIISEREIALGQAQTSIDFAEKVYNDALSNLQDLEKQYTDLKNKIDQINEQITNCTDEQQDFRESPELESSRLYGTLESIADSKFSVKQSLPELERAVTLARDSYNNIVSQYDSKISEAQNLIDEEKYQEYNINQSDLDRLSKKMDECVVKAPVSGIISGVNVSNGIPAFGNELAKIINTSDYHVTATISENKIVGISQGMDVLIRTVATGDNNLKGVISNISSYGSKVDNSVIYSVDVDITDDSNMENVLLNMTANVTIIRDVIHDTFAVPYDAIGFEDNEDYILIAEPYENHYKLKKITVEKGVDTNYLCEIKSDSLPDTMMIITSPDDYENGEEVDVSFK